MIDEPIAQSTPAGSNWELDVGEGSLRPRSALDVLTNLNERIASGNIDEFQPIATGFVPLDKTIGGGLRPGELMLIGGAQGQGKTTMALQMARNAAASGQATALYVCFEHEEEYLIQRMIAMESALAHLPKKSRRGQDPGRQEGGPRQLHRIGRGGYARQAGRQPTAASEPRAHRPLWQQPLPAARHGDEEHHREPARTGAGASG